MGAALRTRAAGGVIWNALIAFVLAASCTPRSQAPTTMPSPAPPSRSEPSKAPDASAPLTQVPPLIPLPASVQPGVGEFPLDAGTRIYVRSESPEAMVVGEFLAETLAPATGFAFDVRPAVHDPPPGSILLEIVDGDASLGAEGYLLSITPDQVQLTASGSPGLFYGVQTLRQLLPPAIEAETLQPGPWRFPALSIRDIPRYPWRGAMLDVARHFIGADDIRRFIDRMAYYKLNRLHLHLTDDQGWRIEIHAHPELTALGGRTAVGGDAGGFLTQEDYAEIVSYAQAHYITVVPEIDMPGHTNAALASIPELNCDGVAPAPYTGIDVGFSSLCIGKETTYDFVDTVLGELAALTPGPFLHIGGDEAKATSDADYRTFIERVQSIVEAHGKRMIGWEEIARAELRPGSVAQHWSSDLAAAAVEQGLPVIMSPASRVYIDMQYDSGTRLGLHWAGYIEVRDAYEWDPATQVAGVAEGDLLGVEAPLWTETIRTLADIDFMAFPRLAAIAEVAWSPQGARHWTDFRERLAGHGPRLTALGVGFYRSPQVEWE